MNYSIPEMTWEADAACLNLNLNLFFDEYIESAEVAHAVDSLCNQCPVNNECLKRGYETTATGVWGGMYLCAGEYSRAGNGHKPMKQKDEEQRRFDEFKRCKKRYQGMGNGNN